MSDAGAAASVPFDAPFDARPLTEPVDRAAVRDAGRRMREKGGGHARFSTVSGATGALISAVAILAIVGIFFWIFSSVLVTASGSGSPGELVGAGALPIVIVGAAIALIAVAWVRGGSRTQERWYRLSRFAAANGMSFESSVSSPHRPGMVFGVGGSRVATDVVRGTRPRFVEFANYRYTTGSGKSRTTHRWGYVAIKLDVPLPHIVLDATSNNGLFGASNLPASFGKDQRLGLEGDFDRFFSLYCPAGYERDALYLFTPDIMARFIDNAAALDVEIVDDWLFFYGKRDFSTLDPATWAWLFGAVGALLDKLAQWARWRDERLRADAAASASPDASPDAGSSLAVDSPAAAAVAAAARALSDTALPFAAPGGVITPPPVAPGHRALGRGPIGVAPPGRRLQRRVSWVSIAFMVGIVAWWIVSQAGVFGQFFGD